MEVNAGYEWLRDIPGLDLDGGIENCGSFDSFMGVLTVFYKSAKESIDEIRQSFETKDFPSYTVKVHGLKSAARIIGAAELSAAAKALEDAGRAEDADFIEAHNDRLLEMYGALEMRLGRLDVPEEEKKTELTGAELEEAFQTLSEVAGMMDYGLMDDLLESLKRYRINEKDTELIRNINRSLMRLDWDGIRDLLRQR
ncbi:MAG: Hpt domain-containing protein [Lachnospiraceae bacterium]|nr:Hpt domain-containing protein [Lachnospiraceae bacterium]